MATRREELAEAATDYALEHGLIGLSLRPLADALGHQRPDAALPLPRQGRPGRDDPAHLDDPLGGEHPRAAAVARPARRGPRPLARRSTGRLQQRCQRLYVEAAALGLFGHEPYATEVREANAALDGGAGRPPRRAGLGAAAARQAANLVDAAFMGLQLDQPLDSRAQQRRTVGDLADARRGARWGVADGQPGSA